MDENHHLFVDLDDVGHDCDRIWNIASGYSPSHHDAQQWNDMTSDVASEGADSWIVVSDEERWTPEKRSLRGDFREGRGSVAEQLPFAPPSPCQGMRVEPLLDDLPSEDKVAASVESAASEISHSAESTVIAVSSGDTAIATSKGFGSDSQTTTGSDKGSATSEIMVSTDADATQAVVAKLEQAPAQLKHAVDEPSDTALPLKDAEAEKKQLTQLVWDVTSPALEVSAGSHTDEIPQTFPKRVWQQVEVIYHRHKGNLLPVFAAHIASFLIGLYIGRKSIALASTSTARSPTKIVS